jgi:peptidoglycan/LPS O-acetylase OafA/YrhL
LQDRFIVFPCARYKSGPFLVFGSGRAVLSCLATAGFSGSGPEKTSCRVRIAFVGSLLLRFNLAYSQTIYHIINRSTLCRMDSLLAGGALALLLRGRLHDAVLRYAPAVFGVGAGLFSLGFFRFLVERHPGLIFPFDASFLALRYTFQALMFAGLIAWCLQRNSVPRLVFELRPLRFLGKYSYGLYVLHVLALGLLLGWFKSGIGHFTQNKPVAIVGAGVLAFMVSVAAAWLSFNFYEKPFLRLKHYFDYDRSPVTKPVPSEDAVTAGQLSA